MSAMEKVIGRSQWRSRREHLDSESCLVVVILLIAGCSPAPVLSTETASIPSTSPGTSAAPRLSSAAGSSALKQIDQAALQTMLDKTARELLIPGAVILLRTPQGQFTVTYGTTLLGATTPPRADTTSAPRPIPRR